MLRAPSILERLAACFPSAGLAGFTLAVAVVAPAVAGDPYAIAVPPRPDPIAEAWREAAARPPEPRTAADLQQRKGKDGGPRPWEQPNLMASTSLCEKFPHNPVLLLGKKGSLDAGHAEYPSVVTSRGLFWLFYSAYGAHHRWEIAAAVAPDGINWTKLGVVFTPDTTTAAWDSTTIAFPERDRRSASAAGRALPHVVCGEARRSLRRVRLRHVAERARLAAARAGARGRTAR